MDELFSEYCGCFAPGKSESSDAGSDCDSKLKAIIYSLKCKITKTGIHILLRDTYAFMFPFHVQPRRGAGCKASPTCLPCQEQKDEEQCVSKDWDLGLGLGLPVCWPFQLALQLLDLEAEWLCAVGGTP